MHLRAREKLPTLPHKLPTSAMRLFTLLWRRSTRDLARHPGLPVFRYPPRAVKAASARFFAGVPWSRHGSVLLWGLRLCQHLEAFTGCGKHRRGGVGTVRKGQSAHTLPSSPPSRRDKSWGTVSACLPYPSRAAGARLSPTGQLCPFCHSDPLNRKVTQTWLM